ncbi:UNVERIFIED_CONTAM: hypothetical protein RMT77_007920 [Armadillidium vulgare]
MSKPTLIIRRVSRDPPDIFSMESTMPDVPPKGATIRVKNAGVCYLLSSASSKRFSINSKSSLLSGCSQKASVRDTSLYPGFEVSGYVSELGDEAKNSGVSVGDRVIVYPYEDHPDGYDEYIAIPDVKYLVKVPDDMTLSVAAMLPSGALWAINTVFQAQKYVESVLQEKGEKGICKLLLVGTGGLALWALRISRYFWSTDQERIKVVVACLRDEGIFIAMEESNVSIVRWNEVLHEEHLIERTMEACGGPVDIVIDFNATSRSSRRALKCLVENGGALLFSSERSEGLLAKLATEAENHKLVPIQLGSLDQLKTLVQLVSDGKIEPPPHQIFPADNVREAFFKTGRGQVNGRAILEFPDEGEDEEEESKT